MSSFEMDDLKTRMDKAIEVLRKEFAGLRTGRASANLLDPIMVPAYGGEIPISQVGTVTTPEPRLLSLQVWDKNLVKAAEKAIRSSELGLNPSADGTLIRIPLPELTEERRTELAKVAARYAEAARVAIRSVRRDGMDQLKKLEKDGEISQDEHKKSADRVQTLTDQEVKRINELLAAKEAEIMTV